MKFIKHNEMEENSLRVRYWFFCPGCQDTHSIVSEDSQGEGWKVSGEVNFASFPSIDCHPDNPARRCHSFVRNGQIQFQNDCWHELKEKTVDLPDIPHWLAKLLGEEK